MSGTTEQDPNEARLEIARDYLGSGLLESTYREGIQRRQDNPVVMIVDVRDHGGRMIAESYLDLAPGEIDQQINAGSYLLDWAMPLDVAVSAMLHVFPEEQTQHYPTGRLAVVVAHGGRLVAQF